MKRYITILQLLLLMITIFSSCAAQPNDQAAAAQVDAELPELVQGDPEPSEPSTTELDQPAERIPLLPDAGEFAALLSDTETMKLDITMYDMNFTVRNPEGLGFVMENGTITDDLDGTTTNEVSAYNESTYSPERQQTVDQTNERTLDTERSDNRDYTRQHDERNSRTVYGNIGTMTSQDMFNQELDLLARFNPYDWIVDRMERELFLGIW